MPKTRWRRGLPVVVGVLVGAVMIVGVAMATLIVVMRPCGRDGTTKNSMVAVQTALKLYYARHGNYPRTSQGLQVLVTEKFLDRLPKDAWVNDLVYTNEGERYRLVSFGADGRPGGDGVDADISSDQLNARAGSR